ncbi:MAG: hypothetical protein KDD40_10790, partial [Bdellovibrionales bacterium]|nr:hypothetical protein [Bdellovibrionales bacterium]
MKKSQRATLSQQLKLGILIIFGLSLSPFVSFNNPQVESGSNSLSSINSEILARVESIAFVPSTRNPEQSVPEVEILNLNYGASLKSETLKLCGLDDKNSATQLDSSQLLMVEQTLKLLQEAKDKGQLIKLAYSSEFEKCI